MREQWGQVKFGNGFLSISETIEQSKLLQPLFKVTEETPSFLSKLVTKGDKDEHVFGSLHVLFLRLNFFALDFG